MLSLPGGTVIYAARDPADFRKAFDGLCQIVRDEFDRDPFTGDLFVIDDVTDESVCVAVLFEIVKLGDV